MTLGGEWSEIDFEDYDALPEGASPNWTIVDEINLPDIVALLKCRKCGHPTAGVGSTQTECWVGDCTELRCVNCGENWGGWGPVGCPCQSRHPKIRRIRQMYRARKR